MAVENPCSCSLPIILPDTSKRVIMTLRDMLEKRVGSRWLQSLEKAEEVVVLVSSLLSGSCRIKVMEEVEEELLMFSMEETMTALIDPVTGYLEVGFLLLFTLLFLLLLPSRRDHLLGSCYLRG